jgi:2-dehydropantoate 2-reductase
MGTGLRLRQLNCAGIHRKRTLLKAMIEDKESTMKEISWEYRSRELSENMRSLKVAVAGAGAIGSLIGGRLTEAGVDVWLVDSWREHVKTMQNGGLRLEGPSTTSTIGVKAVHTSEIDRLEPIDIILLSVKSYDTLPMVKLLKSHLNRNAFVVSCQNGMNEETIASVVGPSSTLGCIIYLGASLLAPGHVKQLRRGGRFMAGEYTGGVTKRIKTLGTLLSLCADTTITDDLRGERWAKLADNCTGNPLLAITGYTARELHADQAGTPIRRALIREIVLVAEALGERVKPILAVSADLWKIPLSVSVPEINQGFSLRAKVLVNARSSMSYDMEQGRPLEIDALNGYVLKKGREIGVETPVNAALVSMTRNLSQGIFKPDPKNLAILLEVVEKTGP